MSLEQRRRQLKIEFAKGISNRDRINRLLNVAEASIEDDLRTALALAETGSLRLLRAKLRKHQVVRQAYHGYDGTGCLLYFLLGFESNDDLLDYPYASEAALDGTCRCVRAWDYKRLDAGTVLRILDETIAGRNRLNALEDAAIGRAVAQAVH